LTLPVRGCKILCRNGELFAWHFNTAFLMAEGGRAVAET
jgi:hypothetical protein